MLAAVAVGSQDVASRRPPCIRTASPLRRYNAGVKRNADLGTTLEQDRSRTIESAGARPTLSHTRTVRAVLWALCGVMAAAGLLLNGLPGDLLGTTRPAGPPTAPDVGQRAPDLRLPLADGGEVDLADYRGQVLLLNFWATWCAPCTAEMPAIDRVYQAHRERGFAVLAIDVQERDEQVVDFLERLGVTFPSAIDRTGEIARLYRATGLPTTFLIDRDGVIRDVRVGPLTEAMLEERLAKVLS